MEARDAILTRVRAALGRAPGQKPLAPPEPLLRIRHQSSESRIRRFQAALERVGGTCEIVPDAAEARLSVRRLLNGQAAVASNDPLLSACGIFDLPGVQSGLTDPNELRNKCADADVGITSAYCLLADTGTIVLRARSGEPRLISLLPPVHIAVVCQERLLTNLDEMLSMLPRPVEDSSAVVLITGPSRTADIEQFLVRGVHGPRAVHVILIKAKPSL